MAITKNEQDFVRDICSLSSNIAKIQGEIKEQFGLDSIYYEEKGQLKIVSTSINESLNVARAKQFVEEKIAQELLEVIF